MEQDISETRRLVGALDEWLAELAKPLLPLRRIPLENDGFRWEFGEETPRAVQVGKAVRMVSGIRAALLLADSGFTTECASLLRMISDFSKEILALEEGIVEGRLTEEQDLFVKQYFTPFPTDINEFEKRDKPKYVSRDKLSKAHYRLVNKVGGDAEELKRLSRFLDHGFDKYVHGAYSTAMDLYTDAGHRFMLSGHESARVRCVTKAAVAGKLHEVLVALGSMATTQGMKDISAEIRLAVRTLNASGEQSMQRCA